MHEGIILVRKLREFWFFYNSIAIFFTLGTLLLAGMAMWIQNWRTYGLAISLPMLIALVAIFVVPESARYALRLEWNGKVIRIFIFHFLYLFITEAKLVLSFLK